MLRHSFSLYDMDIVFDPPGSGLFSEVYLYEELMEADLHAIVSAIPRHAAATLEKKDTSLTCLRFAPVSLYRTPTSNHSSIKPFAA